MNLFTRVGDESPHLYGVNWLHFQDLIGATVSWGANKMTYGDVVDWFQFLQGTYVFASLRVNMEQFDMGCNGAPVTGSLREHKQREDFYESNGIPLGASYEIRFWINSHQEL